MKKVYKLAAIFAKLAQTFEDEYETPESELDFQEHIDETFEHNKEVDPSMQEFELGEVPNSLNESLNSAIAPLMGFYRGSDLEAHPGSTREGNSQTMGLLGLINDYAGKLLEKIDSDDGFDNDESDDVSVITGTIAHLNELSEKLELKFGDPSKFWSSLKGIDLSYLNTTNPNSKFLEFKKFTEVEVNPGLVQIVMSLESKLDDE